MRPGSQSATARGGSNPSSRQRSRRWLPSHGHILASAAIAKRQFRLHRNVGRREEPSAPARARVRPEDAGLNDLGVAPHDVFIGQVQGKSQVTATVDCDDRARALEDAGSPRPIRIGSHGRNVPQRNLFPVERLHRADLEIGGLFASSGLDP